MTDLGLTNGPARKQVKKGTGPVQEINHHSSDYNIWYHKRLGDRFERDERVKATTRCNVAQDSGYTRADKGNKETYICLYFARGHCSHGAECTFYHRIPTIEDELRLDLVHDIFGRERFKTYRDDMGGVGSFSRDNRTLYLVGFKRQNISEEILTRHFIEWGELEYVRVIWDKSIAFVRYKLRGSAEFAKEAMQAQSLDHDELLDVRWANEDPNPVAQQREELNTYLQMIQTVKEKRMYQEPFYQYNMHSYYYPTGTEATENYSNDQQLNIQAYSSINSSSSSVSSSSTATAAAAFYYDYFPSQQFPEQYPDTSAQYPERIPGSEDRTFSEAGRQEVAEWLAGLSLSRYLDAFLAGGFFDRLALLSLDEFALDAIGIRDLQHRSILLKAASDLSSIQMQQQQRNHPDITSKSESSEDHLHDHEKNVLLDKDNKETTTQSAHLASENISLVVYEDVDDTSRKDGTNQRKQKKRKTEQSRSMDK